MAPGLLAGRAILVVEDEPLLAMLLGEELQAAGARVLGPAATPAEALACLAGERPDAAVLDRHLRGEDARPVAAELARLGIPFVVTTGDGIAGLPEALTPAAVFAKPYEAEALLAGLARLIG